LALLGDYAYFGSTPASLPLGGAWIVVPICAIVGGLGGGLFSRLLIFFARGLPGRAGALLKRHPILFAAFCGICVAFCGISGHDSIYGTGYEQARAIIHSTDQIPNSFGPLKFLATFLSAISGIPGGIFAPSLAVGAGLGADLQILFHDIPIGALALLGMVSYLTGVVQTPITSFVIVSEMTENHAMMIPLMVAAVIAQATSKLVCRDNLYHALSKNFLPPAKTKRAARTELS
jgi:H+/Cl- antiporter ClcA